MNARSKPPLGFALIEVLVTIAIVAAQVSSQADTDWILPKFTITGHFTRELMGEPLIQRTGFRIVSEGTRWEIKTEALQPETHAGAIRLATFKYDGRYVDASVGPGSEIGDFIPPAWSSYVPEQLWLAYLSGPYFATNTSSLARPIWHLDDDQLIKNRFSVQTRREPLELGLGQPRTVEFLSDGKMRLRGEQGPRTLPYPAPFDSGFIEAVFRVISVTNVGGINFPKEFTFERFGPRVLNVGEKPQLIKMVTTHGVLETLKLESPAKPIQWRNPNPSESADRAYRKAIENSPRPSKTDLRQAF